MNIKEHFKKKDWVYYLIVFVIYTVVFFLGSKLFGGEWRYSIISALVSGIIFTPLMALMNHMGKDVEKAVEEDKRMGITPSENKK
jgi:Zn-dependent protease with chaperone function